MPVKEPVTNEVVEAPVTQRKLSVEFGRTVSDGNYGSSSLKAYVQGEVAWEANEGEIAQALAQLASAAKIAVFEDLGIAFHMDEESGILHEDVAAISTARAAQALGATTVAAQPQSGLGFTIKNADTASGEPIPDWAVAAINAAGVKSVFDNRETKSNNQPWFKEAVPRGGVNVKGTTLPNDAMGFWPPK